MNYLYNGVEAGLLPAWDKTTYPNAVMVLYDYSLLNKSDKLKVYFLSEIAVTSELIDSDGTHEDCLWYAEGDQNATAERPVDSTGAFSAFGEVETFTDSQRFSLKNVVWTNTDLYKTDGTLYLAASDPVPVTPTIQRNPAELMAGYIAGMSTIKSRR